MRPFYQKGGLIPRVDLLLTRGLLYHLTYDEMRAVLVFLLGCVRSGLLPQATILSGLQTIGTRLAGGYIEGHVKKKFTTILDTILGGWGYLFFSALNHQATLVGREMVQFSEDWSLENTSSIEHLFTALIKVSYLTGVEEENFMRTGAVGLKPLTFQDPSISLRDRIKLQELVVSQNIRLERLMGNTPLKQVTPVKENLHMFEKYWLHSDLENRLGKIVEVNRA